MENNGFDPFAKMESLIQEAKNLTPAEISDAHRDLKPPEHGKRISGARLSDNAALLFCLSVTKINYILEINRIIEKCGYADAKGTQSLKNELENDCELLWKMVMHECSMRFGSPDPNSMMFYEIGPNFQIFLVQYAYENADERRGEDDILATSHLDQLTPSGRVN